MFRAVASPNSRSVCSCWIFGRRPPLPIPTKLCNTDVVEQPVVIAFRVPVFDLTAGTKGVLCLPSSPPAQHLTNRGPHSPQPEEGRSQQGQGLGQLAGTQVSDVVLGQTAGVQQGEGSGPNLNAFSHLCPSPQAPAGLGTPASSQGIPGQQAQDILPG